MPKRDADVAVIEEAVDGRCIPVAAAVADVNGCSMLRLVVAMPDGSSTWPGMLAVAVAVAVAVVDNVGGAGSGSKLIVVVVLSVGFVVVVAIAVPVNPLIRLAGMA